MSEGSPIKLALYGRKALAKDAGVDPEGTGSSRLLIVAGDAAFTDPDGFAWGTAAREKGSDQRVASTAARS